MPPREQNGYSSSKHSQDTYHVPGLEDTRMNETDLLLQPLCPEETDTSKLREKREPQSAGGGAKETEMNFRMVPHLRVPCPHANARVKVVLSSAVACCGVEQRHTMGLFLEEHRIIRTCIPLRAQHAMFFNTTRIDQASTLCLARCQILGMWRPGHGPCLQQGPCRARWLSTTCDNSSLRAFFFFF